MWKIIKDFLKSFALDSPPEIDGGALKRIATAHGINRRKNARIIYPKSGAIGPFPSVYYKNKELNIANISVGGLLVTDQSEILGAQVGESILLEIKWPDFSTKMKAKIVGAILKRRHIQFADFNPQAFVRISDLVKPGYIGQKFYKIDNPSGQLEALEMWVGPTNESLVFLDNEIIAEYNSAAGKVLFPANSKPHLAREQKSLTAKELQDYFVQFTNLPNPTPRVLRLIESLNRWFCLEQNENKRTGTHG